MNLYIRYKKSLFEDIYQTKIDLHKNNKGYNIQINGKFYFPYKDSPILKQLDKVKDKELWVAITRDEINYGNFSFAVPDYFVKVDEKNKQVLIEKEVPLNDLDNPDEPFVWDYVIIAKCDSVDKTDAFIDELEDLEVPEPLIKEAITEFYNLINC